ncbi:MAG: CRISPR-associated protein Cas4 [Brevinematales bacterium]|nr:CRISPR-associated protein Cas4 [Brevinematales bacterium]
MEVNGTLIWYYTICKREAWLIGHRIVPDQKDNRIMMGRHIHKYFFSREKAKEVLIDNTIKVDLVKGRRLIVEIKKSSKFIDSTRWQLLFYLYYLKHKKGVVMEGEISIPDEKKRVLVRLSEESEKEIEKIIGEIEELLKQEKSPKPEWIKYCKVCGYKEMCWV